MIINNLISLDKKYSFEELKYGDTFMTHLNGGELYMKLEHPIRGDQCIRLRDGGRIAPSCFCQGVFKVDVEINIIKEKFKGEQYDK